MLAVMHKLNDSLLIDQESAGQHGRIACCLSLCMSFGMSAQAGLKHSRRKKLFETAALQSISAMRLGAGIGQAGDFWRQASAKMNGMFGFANCHRHNLDSGVCEHLLMLSQLGQPFSAENSAKVAQKCEYGGTILPKGFGMNNLSMNIDPTDSGGLIANFEQFFHR